MDTLPDADAIARELHEIIHHERAREILANDWVADSSLPIPSIRAILLLAALLGDPRTVIKVREGRARVAMNLFDYAGARPLDEVIPALVTYLRTVPPGLFREAARQEGDLLESMNLRLGSSRSSEWADVLRLFMGLSGGGGPVRDAGARSLARRFLEALVLRAVLHRDTPALQALARGVADLPPETPVTHRIASEIRAWQIPLSEALPRELTKGAMRAFLIELYPYFGGAVATTWADAWKLAGWSMENDRKGPRKNDDAIAIARKIRAQRD